MRDIHPFRLVIEDLPAVEQLTPEEMARIFGAGKTSFTRLGVEPLEERLALTWGAVPPAVFVPPAASTAVNLNAPGGAAGAAAISRGEVDWYRFTPAATGTYTIATATPTSALDTVLAAYSTDGTRLAFNNDAGDSPDSRLSVELTRGQTYLFGVTNYTGSAGGAYRWSVARPLADDTLEQNDTMLQARALGSLTGRLRISDLALADSSDWFRFSLRERGATGSQAAIHFQNDQGNLNLYLYNSRGVLIGRSIGTGDAESVSLAGRPAGTYYLRVAGIANPRYDLALGRPNSPPVLGEMADVTGRHDAPIQITLPARDADGEELSFLAEVLGGGQLAPATASLSGSVLTLTPAAGFVGTFDVRVTVSDGEATAERTVRVHVTNDAPTLTAIPDVSRLHDSGDITVPLTARDADQDALTLSARMLGEGATVAVVEGNLVITPQPGYTGTFQVEVTAGDGLTEARQTFTVTITNTAPIPALITRQFIVSGRPRVIELTARDADEGDVVTFTAARVEGGAPYTAEIIDGKLHLTPVADFTGEFQVIVTVSDGAASVDRSFTVTAAGFEELAYLRLLHPHSDGGFRDDYGFIISRGSDLQQGDAMIFTGLATSLAALRGDDAAVRSLLLTLRDWSFDPVTGAMIRHPDIYDYVKDASGQLIRDVHAPVTKDGVLGVMTGAYHAFTAGGMSDETRALAREVMGKYIDYLIARQWKTIDRYPDHYWAQVDREVEPGEDPKKSFANVFNDTGGGVMWKGPEAYALAPNDVYALQNAAAEMGFVTSHWQPWVGFGTVLVQTLGDGLATFLRGAGDRLAARVGERFAGFLGELKVHKEYSFHVIPGIDATLVKGSLDFELSQADRDNIVAGVQEAVRGVVRDFLGGLIDGVTDVPALVNMCRDMLGRIVDRVLDFLPDWLDADRARTALTDTLQQIMPWLNGNAFGELIAFRLSHELAKMDEITAHLSFWPTLLMYETRPEMVDLLGPSVRDLDAYLHDLTVDVQQNRTDPSEFWDKDLRRMDMLLYAWLDGEQGRVAEWLGKFETDYRYENLSYPWKKSHEENVKKIQEGAANPGLDTELHRLDYLLLKQLERHGVPESATGTVGDWLRHWGKVLDEVADAAIAKLRQGAQEAWNAIEQAARDLADFVGREVTNARDYFDERLRTAGGWLDNQTAEWNTWYNQNVGAWRDWLQGAVKDTYASASQWYNQERDRLVGEWGTWYNQNVGAWRDWLKGAVKDTYSSASQWYGQERDRLIGEWGTWYNTNYTNWRNWLEGAISQTYEDAAEWLRQGGGAVGGFLGQILSGFSLGGTNWLSLPDWASLPRWAQDYINGYITDFNNAVNGFWRQYESGVASVRQSYNGLITTLSGHVNNAGTDWLALKDWNSLPGWARDYINGYFTDFNNAIDGFQRDLGAGLASLRTAYDAAVAEGQAELDAALAHWQEVLDAGLAGFLASRQDLVTSWQRRLDEGMGELARS